LLTHLHKKESTLIPGKRTNTALVKTLIIAASQPIILVHANF